MINLDRIVPIQKTDFLTLIATILNINNTPFRVANAKTVEGDFAIEADGNAGFVLCNQPVKTLDFADGTTAATVYFVPAHDFVGISIAETPAEIGEVNADGASLYKAVLADSAVTLTDMSVAPVA